MTKAIARLDAKEAATLQRLLPSAIIDGVLGLYRAHCCETHFTKLAREFIAHCRSEFGDQSYRAVQFVDWAGDDICERKERLHFGDAFNAAHDALCVLAVALPDPAAM